MPLAQLSHLPALAYLAAGLLGLLASVLVITRGLIADGEAAPTRRAVAHWIPIATAAVIAAFFGHHEIALGIAFGSSVAVLSSVAGFVVLAGPLEHLPPPVRRVWPFLIVPALLVFVLGFRGNLGLFDAFLLLIQGILCAIVWGQWPASPLPFAAAGNAPASARLWALGTLEAVAGALIALIAGYAAVRGAISFSQADPRFPTSVMGATLFSVVLALPMVTTGVPAATHGRAYAALSAQVGVVLLNLGALLPVIILIACTRRMAVPATWAGLLQAAAPRAGEQAPFTIVYPRIAWRIDAVAILILALLFMAVADRRVRFSKGVAGALVLSYLVYLLLVMYVTHWMS